MADNITVVRNSETTAPNDVAPIETLWREFRQTYVEFASPEKYPDPAIANAYTMAEMIRTNKPTPCADAKKLKVLLYLLTAHYLYLRDKIKKGDQTGLVNSASIGGVSISLTMPERLNDFRVWLSQSPYGQQYLALVAACNRAGMWVGGRPETLAYPRARLLT